MVQGRPRRPPPCPPLDSRLRRRRNLGTGGRAAAEAPAWGLRSGGGNIHGGEDAARGVWTGEEGRGESRPAREARWRRRRLNSPAGPLGQAGGRGGEEGAEPQGSAGRERRLWSRCLANNGALEGDAGGSVARALCRRLRIAGGKRRLRFNEVHWGVSAGRPARGLGEGTGRGGGEGVGGRGRRSEF